MNVPPLVWILTIAAACSYFGYELVSQLRSPHASTISQAARWSAIDLGLALIFGVGIGMFGGWESAGDYFASYFTEKALSVDNMFVILLIMTTLAVPHTYRQMVLTFGIVVALILRVGFILMGGSAVKQFSGIFYIFGMVLIIVAVHQILRGTPLARGLGSLIRRSGQGILNFSRRPDRSLTARSAGKRVVTPIFMAIAFVVVIDVAFAVDSVPVLYGLTSDTYIILTANIFALMGLRQLFFLIAGLLDRLKYLKQGLVAILAFIGVKLVLHALHLNTVPFINGGRHIKWIPEVPIWLSLLFIGSTVAIVTTLSLIHARRTGERRSVRSKNSQPESSARTTPPIRTTRTSSD
jgi:tellurite resistance protein TerC